MGGNRPRRALLLTLLVSIAFLASRPMPALAQAGVEFQDVAAFVEFGKTVTFQAVIASETAVQEAVLTIHPQGVEAVIQPVTLNAQNQIVYQLDLVSTPLRPFSRVQYAFRLLLANGNSVDSPSYTFDYTDTRFAWQSLSNDQFEIFWYDREIALGQRALNSAQLGLQSIQNILPVSLEESVRIYIYNTANDFKGALPGSQPWIAGQSAPDLGVILLTIPVGPEDQLMLERQLPHELMHVVLYQLAGEKTANLPAWLVEGLASVAEINPNPDYASTVNASAAEDKLIPLENLCGSMPRDASGAFLAYAESASFVRYLHRTYGASAMRWLVEQYQNGLGCSEGIQTALGSSLTQLEYRWKEEELRLNPGSLIFRNLLPYLLLFLVLFGAAALTIIVTARRTSHPREDVEEYPAPTQDYP